MSRPAATIAPLAGTLLLLALLLSACGTEPSGDDPPLRPLLYTEPSGEQGTLPEGYEQWTGNGVDPVTFPSAHGTQLGDLPVEGAKRQFDTPTKTLRSLMNILRLGGREELASLIPAPSELVEHLRFSESAARAQSEAIGVSLSELYDQIHASARPEFRRANWGSLMQVTQIEVGPPRSVEGAIVDAPDAVMHDTNRISLHLVGTDVDFAVRVPRLFRSSDGRWILGRTPGTTVTYDRLLALGLDEKAEIMTNDQASFPFREGNFWDYVIESRRDGEWLESRGEGFRDTVEEVQDYGFYRVITLRRTFRNPTVGDTRTHYLQTPTRLYTCGGRCRRAASSLDAILQTQTRARPLMLFPLRESASTSSADEQNLPIISELESTYEVPSGIYDRVYRVHRSREEHSPDLFVRPGTGILAYEWREAGIAHRASLRATRILR